jgi:regulation of enolase protein 1 (concanavalin A-like superfamily)
MRRRVEYLVVCAFVCAMAIAAVEILVAQTALPSPWTGVDIGAPSPAGTSSFSNQTFTVSASGVDIWGTTDQFRFVYQQVVGDVDVIARVDSLAAADPWSKAGVMIRADLSAASAHAYALVSGAHGIAFQRRLQAGGVSSTTAAQVIAAPQWVRLKRVGNVVTAYSSGDGGTWQTVGSATIGLNQSAFVGFAVTSHNPGSLASAVFSQPSVTGAAATTALPSGQQTRDIGTPAVAGSATYSGGTYTISGAGADISGTADQFRYVYQPLTGDVDVSARVASVQNVDKWTKAGLMVRESLNANARHAMALITAGHGYTFQWRLDTGGLADFVSGPKGRAPTWVRLVRTGFRFEAFSSTNGTSWTSMGVETVPMTDPVYVGLAVTSHSASQAATAVFDNLSISSSTPANKPPTVSLTAPAQGATFTAPATINLAATASDPENQLARVEFYNGSTLIASDTTAPFTAALSSVAAGTYSLTAVAVDAAGNRTTSSAVSVTVNAAVSVPHFVVFQKSTDDATLVTSYRFDVFANGANPATATPLATSNLGHPAADTSGTITVDQSSFFAALAPGTYVATVSAIDSGGAGRSAPVTFMR